MDYSTTPFACFAGMDGLTGVQMARPCHPQAAAPALIRARDNANKRKDAKALSGKNGDNV